MLATFVWLWGIGVYYIIKNFNQKSVPGIHTDLKTALLGDGGKTGSGGNDEKSNTITTAPDHETSEKQRKGGQPPKLETRSHENGHARKKSEDPPLMKDGLDSVGKTTSVDVGEGTVNGVTNKVNGSVSGITKNLPIGGSV